MLLLKNTDREHKAMPWKDGFEIYYPQGIDDEDYCILKFTWEAYRTNRRLFKLIEHLHRNESGFGSHSTASKAPRFHVAKKIITIYSIDLSILQTI